LGEFALPTRTRNVNVSLYDDTAAFQVRLLRTSVGSLGRLSPAKSHFLRGCYDVLLAFVGLVCVEDADVVRILDCTEAQARLLGGRAVAELVRVVRVFVRWVRV